MTVIPDGRRYFVPVVIVSIVQWEEFLIGPWAAVPSADSYLFSLTFSVDGVVAYANYLESISPFRVFPLNVGTVLSYTINLPPSTFWTWNVSAIIGGVQQAPTADVIFTS